MQHLEVICAVERFFKLLGFKELSGADVHVDRGPL